jgi:hypothetical protein
MNAAGAVSHACPAIGDHLNGKGAAVVCLITNNRRAAVIQIEIGCRVLKKISHPDR